MDEKARPRIAVLMATYNGASWLLEQISSILASEDVDVTIYVSDDGSTDETLALLYAFPPSRVQVLPAVKSGGAGQNFIRAFLDAPWDSYDFVAFADQDDIWLPGKLIQAVRRLLDTGAQGYSSDVTAFWPDGTTRYVKKSQPLQRWDYHFESGGPGNTFVLPVRQALSLRSRLRSSDPNVLRVITLHDWLIYALVRSEGHPWIIDNYSGVEYRQHAENVIGAAGGGYAILARFDMIRSGWYQTQILAIAEIAGRSNPVVEYLRKPTVWQIWVPFRHVRKCRRRALEAILFALAVSVMSLSRRK
ncbi:glycosyltransferase (plasmid) [Sulfitobacter faviae]|uniref:glycosyltransferase n=1 Tax=Sulfitobacter faviae TaxID=1775881 RepID=UPI002307C4BD|nr:glycosyltransferase [Sulfitobacter faviae]WCE68580.1 glycosyltransferase [Sulfitobacter faviae]